VRRYGYLGMMQLSLICDSECPHTKARCVLELTHEGLHVGHIPDYTGAHRVLWVDNLLEE